MVYVRLAQDWTDESGKAHAAGEMVDVDAATLAALEAGGVVEEPDGGWPKPDGGWPKPDGGWPKPDAGSVGPSSGGDG